MKPNWLDYLQPGDLHGDYAELAAVIGLELTIKYAQEYGGEPLVLPYLKADLSDPEQLRSGYLDIYAITGSLELTNAVASQLGGGQLYLPKADHLLLAAKERYILDHDKVSNRKQLRRDTGLSMRHVYRICEGKTQARRNKHAVDPRQLSLLDSCG